MVEVAEQRYTKELNKATYYVNEIKETVNFSVKEDVLSAYEKICDVSKTLEASANLVKEAMLDDEKSFEDVKGWSHAHKEKLVPIHELRSRLKDELRQLETQELHRREEDWFKKKIELEMELEKKKAEQEAAKPQAVKLQKYTISPFKGDCKDWLRFWNQFVVEVDNSKISEISKFNYLLELVEGEPKEHILGLPHTPEGYNEAKKILELTFGKDIKVHKALIKDLEALPNITSVHKIKEIHDFHTQLSKTVRTLATMKKLGGAQSYVYSVMDKLGPVREVMAQKDDDWEEWGLEELVDNLRKYTDRNPLPLVESNPPPTSDSGNQDGRPKGEDKLLMSGGNSRQPQGPPPCVYCGLKNHRSSECTKILDIASRREYLTRNKLCFNCARSGHVASKCKSRGCGKCNGRHHTSVCNKMKSTLSPQPNPGSSGRSERFYGVVDTQTTLHATVIAKINGVQARIMLDSGAGSSYISSKLLTELNLKPYKSERRIIEQMYGTVDREVEIYKVNVESNVIEGFGIELHCINAEKPVLTHLPNPRIAELKKANHRIKRLNFSEEAVTDPNLPVHVILGAADIQRIKTTEPAILGKNPNTDPGAEFTMLGWTITGKSMLSGTETEKGFFLKSGQHEFKQMCSQEVLGLTDEPDVQGLFHEDFKNQLQRLDDGTYLTRLPWKSHQPAPLPVNKGLTLKRLQSTTRKLERMEKLNEYHTVMEQQLEEGILELVPEVPTGEVIHYIPHQAVIREEAESTKMRIVYDCSAKQNPQAPSLNDCLEVGPPLQPAIFDILLRNRLKPFCITGDIKKAFLQIKISPADRDALRLLWYDNLKERNIVQYRFTRVIFGSGPSPYILGATLEKHIGQYKEKYPNTVNELLQNTYVDDVQSGGDGMEELLKFKKEATQIMNEGGFQLHKWHSNIPGIEKPSASEVEEPQENSTYAKLTVGTQPHESKILGVPWNKEEDTFSINFAKTLKGVEEGPLTKRKMLSAINSIFDLLGIAAPVVIVGKILYSEVCLRKLRWDEEVPVDIQKPWTKWLNGIKECLHISIPRSVVGVGLTRVVLHGFSDASKLAVSVAVYAVTTHIAAPVQQRLLVAKSRIASKDQSIPRLELVAAHTLSRLIHHVKEVLKDERVEEYHCWVDSTTVLYWIKGQGTWSQFVRNRTRAIQDKKYLQWHHVPTADNPSDQGSRGMVPSKMGELWFRGPKWLSTHEEWPNQPEVTENSENCKERVKPKHEKQLLVKIKEETNETKDTLLSKYASHWKLLRVTAYLKRFIQNCRNHKKYKGPLMTEELQAAEKFWIIRAQATVSRADVGLKKDEEGILRCVGRVPNYHPVFLPRNSKLASLIAQQVHEQMLHGGVSITMCRMREKYWIPKLRSLAKTVIHNCNVCKRYWKKPISTSRSPDSTLPVFRTELTSPFSVTGVDFAGPVHYKINKSTSSKAYIALFTCSSTRAVHLKLCHDLSAQEFQRALKEFVARRGCPQIIVSDNGKTFVATGKWLSRLKKDQRLANYLGALEIKWKFNLARAPWWGGFFERLIGIMKRSLSKVIGQSLLTFQELAEVLLDVEMTMNNRPLVYQGEEFEKPVLTPNTLLRGEPIPILEEDLENVGEEDVNKRMRFLEKSKQHLRKRFMKEYVHALEERQQRAEGNIEKIPSIGEVVLLKSEAKDKALWKLGRVVSKITGKDGTVRGLKLKQGNGYIVERPLQLVCYLEIGGEDSKWEPNPKAEVFVPRLGPNRRAKEVANNLFRNIAEQEFEDDQSDI